VLSGDAYYVLPLLQPEEDAGCRAAEAEQTEKAEPVSQDAQAATIAVNPAIAQQTQCQ
jgi:hypothetical protein